MNGFVALCTGENNYKHLRPVDERKSTVHHEYFLLGKKMDASSLRHFMSYENTKHILDTQTSTRALT